ASTVAMAPPSPPEPPPTRARAPASPRSMLTSLFTGPACRPSLRYVPRTEGTGMRKVLLWAAGNAWLRDRVPRTAAARRAVRRFMPGERMEDALDAAEAFGRQGISTLFTRLGENLDALADADAVAEHYRGLIDAIAERGLDGHVSIKLTQLGLDL